MAEEDGVHHALRVSRPCKIGIWDTPRVDDRLVKIPHRSSGTGWREEPGAEVGRLSELVAPCVVFGELRQRLPKACFIVGPHVGGGVAPNLAHARDVA